MHEMVIARRLVAEALELVEADGDRVTDVEVVLGAAAQLSPESVRQHFELAARGTAAERAELHVSLAPSRYRCLDCTHELSTGAPGEVTCPRCGGTLLCLDQEDLAHVRAIGVGG